MYKKILLPTDGSECAEEAAEHAVLIAGQNNAEIIVLNVLETYPIKELPIEDLTRRVTELFKEEGKKALETISKIIKEREVKEAFKNEIKITLEQKEGSPADMILQTIENEDIDLVVMGASGKGRLERFVIGSVAEKVVRHTKIPVLTVH